MLDINWTFLVQLGFFLTFMLIVNVFLFRPMRSYLARRRRTLDNLKADAGGSDTALAELSAEYTRKLAAAHEENLACRADVRKEALAEQRALIEEAKRQAILTVDAAEDELKQETEAARAHLKSQMQLLTDGITAKVLGRAV